MTSRVQQPLVSRLQVVRLKEKHRSQRARNHPLPAAPVQVHLRVPRKMLEWSTNTRPRWTEWQLSITLEWVDKLVLQHIGCRKLANLLMLRAQQWTHHAEVHPPHVRTRTRAAAPSCDPELHPR